MDDYTLLYNGEWIGTLPKGPVPGIFTNYSQDLLFSMERLSNSPYAVRRLNPSVDTLAFDVEDSVTEQISGSTLQGLLEAGRLFYVDHSAQGNLARITGRYAPACDAYFYISEASGEFLPLAIRTGVGANLIYTPQDEAADWLLAKMMFNTNDSWFVDWYHLASTHEVVQIVWMAAIRTLSVDHPVYALLNRRKSPRKSHFRDGKRQRYVFRVLTTVENSYVSSLRHSAHCCINSIQPRRDGRPDLRVYWSRSAGLHHQSLLQWRCR